MSTGCSGVEKWHYDEVAKDLAKHGIKAVIDSLSVDDASCGGRTDDGTVFFITWVKDKFLLLTMTDENQALVDAFAKIVEYRPFCRYDQDGKVTYEWDKENAENRFNALAGAKNLRMVQ